MIVEGRHQRIDGGNPAGLFRFRSPLQRPEAVGLDQPAAEHLNRAGHGADFILPLGIGHRGLQITAAQLRHCRGQPADRQGDRDDDEDSGGEGDEGGGDQRDDAAEFGPIARVHHCLVGALTGLVVELDDLGQQGVQRIELVAIGGNIVLSRLGRIVRFQDRQDLLARLLEFRPCRIELIDQRALLGRRWTIALPGARGALGVVVHQPFAIPPILVGDAEQAVRLLATEIDHRPRDFAALEQGRHRLPTQVMGGLIDHADLVQREDAETDGDQQNQSERSEGADMQ